MKRIKKLFARGLLVVALIVANLYALPAWEVYASCHYGSCYCENYYEDPRTCAIGTCYVNVITVSPEGTIIAAASDWCQGHDYTKVIDGYKTTRTTQIGCAVYEYDIFASPKVQCAICHDVRGGDPTPGPKRFLEWNHDIRYKNTSHNVHTQYCARKGQSGNPCSFEERTYSHNFGSWGATGTVRNGLTEMMRTCGTCGHYDYAYLDNRSPKITVNAQPSTGWINYIDTIDFTAKDDGNANGISSVKIVRMDGDAAYGTGTTVLSRAESLSGGETATFGAESNKEGTHTYYGVAEDLFGPKLTEIAPPRKSTSDCPNTVGIYWTSSVGSRIGTNLGISLPVYTRYDATNPRITSDIQVEQERLEGYTSETEVVNAIQTRDMTTTFTFTVSDESETAGTDVSGIKSVVLTVQDAMNPAIAKKYPLSVISGTATYTKNPLTPNGATKGILSATFTTTQNLYTDFPNSAYLTWYVDVKDYAGNHIQTSYPSASSDAEDIQSWWGTLQNFSAATFIYNDFTALNSSGIEFEPYSYNSRSDHMTYFRLGETGYVKTYTIGYVDEISQDFGSMGREMATEIAADPRLMDEKYRLGTDTAEDTVSYTFTQANYQPLEVTDSHGTKIPANSKGVSYAGVWMNGLTKSYYDSSTSNTFAAVGNVRIPLYYELQTVPGKTKEDGTPVYKWETHTFSAICYKNNWNALNRDSTKATCQYTIWDDIYTSVHHRIIHET